MPLPHGLLVVSIAFVVSVACAQPPVSPEQQAEQVLTAGQNALNSGDTNTAAEKFDEVIKKFGQTRAALGARFGLAGIQFASDSPDIYKAVEWLKQPAEDSGFPDRGPAMFQYAVCYRLQGVRELEKGGGDAKKNSDAKFVLALKWFYAARVWYAETKQPDWSARAQCEQAEVEIRMGRFRDARGTTEPFTKDDALAKSQYKSLGLYYLGLACFLDKDPQAAFRTFNQGDVFKHPTCGGHARYLTGRIHHLQDETAEASVHYDAVLADYEKAKAAAVEAVKEPSKLKGQPFELARLRALADGPAPDYVRGAAFHTAGLKYEGGKFGEAMEKFQAFVKANDKDPLAADALLRIGYCQVQLRQFDEAVKTLSPLAEKAPRLADQAALWLGKAQLGLAVEVDPTNTAEREKRTKAATETLRQAVDRAREMSKSEPDARSRRLEMLFELGDALTVAKMPKDAAVVFEGLWNENGQLPALRREEVLQRLTVALGAGGDYPRSDDRANEFRRLFPQSTLAGTVAFRSAENALARATELAQKNDRNRAEELKQRYDEAVGKFLEIVSKYPEFERLNHARFGAAAGLNQLGKLDDAVRLIQAIPDADRRGELSFAAYLLGDILLRQTPIQVDPAAPEANKAREKLTAAAVAFESFTGENAKAQDAPAALLKLGDCRKRLGAATTKPSERTQAFQQAREALEKLSKEYPKDPLVGTAKLELAKLKAEQGDRVGAMSDLRDVFTNNDTKNTPTAPLAALHLATLLREENKPADAVKVIDAARKQYEGTLAGDKERAEWVPLLKYHQGVALLEAGRPADARRLLDEVAQGLKEKPLGAEASLRAGQCRLLEARKQLDDGMKIRNQAGNDQNKKNTAERAVQQARNAAFDAAEGLVRRADELRYPLPAEPARARMYYDAVWAFRDLSGEEKAQAMEQARKAAHAKLPQGSPQPDLPWSQVPLTRSEYRAFDTYKKLIDDYADTGLSVDARLEYAELLAERDSHAKVVELLKVAVGQKTTDRPVPLGTIERARMRLGGSLLALRQFADAAMQFDAVTANESSSYRVQALYRAGECHAAAGDHAAAIERLLPFRDKGEWQSIAGVSDRAVLRLGHAQLAAGKPDDAKATFEVHLSRYAASSPLADEVRYGLGLIQQAKGQHDDAVKTFEAIIAASGSQVAAKAKLQIGQCRMAEKRYADAAGSFLLVPHIDDDPDLTFAAMLEAARAFQSDGKPVDAKKLLNKLISDTPDDSDWHKAAKERLSKLDASGGR